MRLFITIVLSLFALNASAQSEKTGLTIGVQSGFEYIHYTEDFINSNGESAMLSGYSTAIVSTFSIEYDFKPQFKLPCFIAVSAGVPLVHFTGKEQGTFERFAQTYVSQKEDVTHDYRMLRVFLGWNAKPVFAPFMMFERALFVSTRSNMVEGTNLGTFEPADPDVTWTEDVWSSHIGAGFQGGIPLEESNQLYVKYRVAALLPIAVFVTNDHPRIQEFDRTLGYGASGFTALGRIALHYNWHPRSSLQFGVNLYSRSWEGDGKKTSGAYWPSNDMDAVPILLGLTWSI